MICTKQKTTFYQALVDQDSRFEGVFFVGVKTTGVFCRPTCTARKPKFEHCEFFTTAQQAILAAFRPCKRCQPLSHPQQSSKAIQRLLQAVEENPDKKWRDVDFKKLAIDASTARRQFKKRFGMTFVEYVRARRIGVAIKQMQAGDKVIDVQLSSGYESGSGFREAFSRIIGAPPSLSATCNILKAAWLDTPLGPVIAIADEKRLYLLEFVDYQSLEREIKQLQNRTNAKVIPGYTQPIYSIEKELNDYFEGKLKEFHTPLVFLGTTFQQSVWQQLQKIPFGETRSYSDIAKAIGLPSAIRAVGRANGTNRIAIVIPCHRVITTNGGLAGYAGGVARKQWLLSHEKKFQ